MDRRGLTRWIKFGLALGVSLAFTAYFLLNTDLREVADALADANYAYVAPALALFAASVVARAARWDQLYRPHRALSTWTLLPSLLVGYAGNNLLPLRAGELLRAQHLADHGRVPRMVSFGTFIMERLFDFIVLAGFVLLGVVVAGEGSGYVAAAAVLFGGTIFGFVVALYFANSPAQARTLVGRRLPIPARFRDEVADLTESFLLGCACLTDRRRFAVVSAMTALAWLLELGMYWVLTPAFGLEADFVSVAFAGSAANVAMSLPAAQGGIGPFHAAAKEALAAFSITGPAVQAYVVALHIFLVAPVSLVGLAVLWRSTLPSVRRRREMAPRPEP